MTNPFYYSVGKRKTSIARLKLCLGTGKIFLNNQPIEIFLKDLNNEINMIKLPLISLNKLSVYDIYVNVHGGGINSQVEAIQLAISRVLYILDENVKNSLKANFFLTRDSRIKERRKYGLKKARKASQYSKR